MDELRRALWNPDTDELGLRKVVDEAFSAYELWSKEHNLSVPAIYHRGKVPGDFAATIPVGKRTIGVAGLNTAFLQLTAGYDFDFRDRIALDPRQLEAACGENPDAWASRHDVCLLLTHHPASWLSLESRIAFYREVVPPGRFAIQLCSNAQTNHIECMQDGPTLLILSPPFTDDTKDSSYNVGSLRLNPSAEPLRLLPRCFFPGKLAKYAPGERKTVVTDGTRRFAVAKRGTYAAEPLASALPLSTFRRMFKLKKESKIDEPDRRRNQADLRPPLRVDFLEIQNYRCLERLTVDFDQSSRMPGQWTCLAGINGAGKSSILQALAIVLLGEPFCRELGGDRLERSRRLVETKRADAQIRAWVRRENDWHYLGVDLGSRDAFSSRAGSVYLKGMFDFWKDMRSQVVLAYGATRNLSDFVDTRYHGLTPDVRRVMTLFDPLTQVATPSSCSESNHSRSRV